MKQIFKITGMTCQHCVKNIEGALGELNGVKKSKVNLKKGNAQITYDPDMVSTEELINKIVETGYQAEVI